MAGEMTGFKLNGAWLQCGREPPYELIRVPVRMTDGIAEIQIDGHWLPCPADGVIPKVDTYRGRPLAGVATNWSLA